MKLQKRREKINEGITQLKSKGSDLLVGSTDDLF